MTLSCHTCQNTVSFCRLSYSLHFKPCASVPVDHLVRDLIDGIEGGFLLGQSQRQCPIADPLLKSMPSRVLRV